VCVPLAGHSVWYYLYSNSVSEYKRTWTCINATKLDQLPERLFLRLKWNSSFKQGSRRPTKKNVHLSFTKVIHLVACEPFVT
jgi:hypothetical protein